VKRFQTRTLEECRQLVASWDAGKLEEVRQVLGEPHPDFLDAFRVRLPSRPAQKKRSARAEKAPPQKASERS